jgi:phosphoglycolate phosphatase
MNELELICFDLDGTLIHSQKAIVESMNFALLKLGRNLECPEHLQVFIGSPFDQEVRQYFNFSEIEFNNFIIFYRKKFLEIGVKFNCLYEGIENLLYELSLQQKKIVIVTTKPKKIAKKIARFLGIDKYLFDIYGSNLNGQNTDKVLLLRQCLNLKENMHIQKNKVVMIGDRKYDVVAAKENQVFSIGVLYGYGSISELKVANPDVLSSSVSNLKSILL